ncbi:glycosyltransferase family 2 protein [Bacillus sp. FJAT-49736]|uniref:glycosyltransferase family 2 protein n=1 Tax=Bacillus sp. FJAT-49736 TaxID=2833582 RepID=UPI001BCA0109|nr:glycosyltransferase family 2 protein [Bacillus sp. FJAT-49736]MBS4172914.1 glycosyltransferase family 2 protein [Bacillus sp. FJAT-49736]
MIQLPQFMKFRRNSSKKDYVLVNKPTHSQLRNIPKVTVITPVFNAAKYLHKTIDSVQNQTIGIDNIEYILIDDGSKDDSRDILLEYSSKYENITVVFLRSNTGTPGYPRNIGLQLSTAKYIIFLDADDWLEPAGLQVLYNILEETGDDYAVGKTIQVQAKGTKIVGEHESCSERRSVSPFSIPQIFQHLGPRARMIRADVIKKNHIVFPEMKFAEDKQFFIDVLLQCRTISTTSAPIYYLNRVENSDRLTNQTNIMQKANYNLKVIRYIIHKNLEIEKEKMILNRLYEFDCITRFFTTPHFQRTRLKRLYYFKLKQILKTTKSLQYDFSDNFFEPFNKTVYRLFCQKQYKELVKLYEWQKNEKIKEIMIKDNLPYWIVPFLEESSKYIRASLYAVYKQEFIENNMYYLVFNLFGESSHTIRDVIIRDVNDARVERILEVKMGNEGNGKLEIPLQLLQDLPNSNYSIFLRYNDYLKVNIRRNDQRQLKHRFQEREFVFYPTVYSNVGLKIRKIVS